MIKTVNHWWNVLDRVTRTISWLVVVFFMGLTIVAWVLPSSMWMTVDTMLVKHDHVGTSNHVVIARTIHRPFWGHWTAILVQQQGSQLVQVCRGTGEDHYDEDDVLPNDLDLTWWMGKDCHLVIGTYRVETRWTWKVFIITKEVSVQSNIFKVFPIGETIPTGAYY